MMADVATVFFALAAITFMGFLAGRVFERTRFPDIPIILGVGLLLGPVNRLLVESGSGFQPLADTLTLDLLRAVGPYMSGFALVVILFEAGMKLDFHAFRRSMGLAFLHTAPIFLLTVAGLSAVAHYVFGMPVLVAVVLGVALSNVGQTVSAAIMRNMRIGEQAKTIGFIEMAIYDMVSIPILVALFAFADGTGGAALGASVQGFAQLISISAVLGGLGGLLWIFVLRRLEDHPHSYMVTLAMLLTVYAANQTLGGSGAVSVLLFGLVVGNRTTLLTFLGRKPAPPESAKVQTFHDEVTFLVRTVFFLYLGMVFRLDLRGNWPVASGIPGLSSLSGTGSLFAVGIALLLAWFVASRWISIHAVSMRLDPETRGLVPVFGHGLGTAVLTTLPFVALQYEPGTRFHDLFSPWEPVFLNAALLVILLTVTLSSLLVWLQERAAERKAAAA
jgi:potassium/hydrogen antiporter